MCIFGNKAQNSANNAATAGAAQTTLATGFNATAYGQANPDVLAAFEAGKGSKDFVGKGLTTPEAYLAYHYKNYGQSEGRKLAPDGQSAGNGNETATPDLITSLTGKTTDTLGDIKTQTSDQIGQIADLTTSLTGYIGQQQQQFAQSQSELLTAMNKAAADQSNAMTKALKDMQDAENSKGQAAKRPNYARALAMNKTLNSGGLSSTNLTGPQGVTGALPLGQTSLLGA